MGHQAHLHRARRIPVSYLRPLPIDLIDADVFHSTDWAGRSMVFADRHPAYDHMDAKKSMTERNGKQAGDPKKAAKAMYEFATMEEPPLRVVVGTDAYSLVMDKIENYQKNYKKYEKISKQYQCRWI